VELIEKGWAYYAFDTPEELDNIRKQAELAKMPNWQYNSISRMTLKNSLTLPADEVAARLEKGDPFVVRFKMPRNEEVRFQDIIRGWVVFSTNELDDKVLYKSDGMPTYHLANIVDDHTMEISHVIRGEEWLPSAPLHVMMYRAFEWEAPLFAHLPLILKPDGNGKLSKRDGDRLGFPVFPIDWTDPKTGEKSSGYRESGYYPEAVANMLALLGWHPSDNQEMFTMDELIQAFSLERVSKSGAKFDVNKAFWFNQQYLNQKSVREIYNDIESIFVELYGSVNQEYAETIIAMMREKYQFAREIPAASSYFFIEPSAFDEEVIRKKWKPETNGLLLELGEWFTNKVCKTPIEFEDNFKIYCESKGIKTGEILQPLRVAVSGAPMGPPIFDMLALLGLEKVLTRLNVCTNFIKL
jgi:glutamyl-tRNA synthetase